MSALPKPLPPGRPPTSGDRSGKVLAYVADPATEAALRQVAAPMLLTDFEIRRGDVRTAARDLAPPALA